MATYLEMQKSDIANAAMTEHKTMNAIEALSKKPAKHRSLPRQVQPLKVKNLRLISFLIQRSRLLQTSSLSQFAAHRSNICTLHTVRVCLNGARINPSHISFMQHSSQISAIATKKFRICARIYWNTLQAIFTRRPLDYQQFALKTTISV
jgi:hypothetical protein